MHPHILNPLEPGLCILGRLVFQTHIALVPKLIKERKNVAIVSLSRGIGFPPVWDLGHLNMSHIRQIFLNIPGHVPLNLLEMKQVQLQLQVGMIDAPTVYIFTSRYSAELLLDEVEAVLEAAHVVEGE